MIVSDGYIAAVTSVCQWISLHFWNILTAIQQIAEHSACIIMDHLLAKAPPVAPAQHTLADTLTEHTSIYMHKSTASGPQ